MNDKHSEWRVITPILLGLLTIVILPIMGFLITDKLNTMNDKSDKLFSIVGGVKSSFDDYKVLAENRFTRIETQLADLPTKVRNDP